MAWDRRAKMNIPVTISKSGFTNDLNMLWEWNWLPDGDPSDTRLQQYYGLVENQNEYELIWPGNVPSIMRISLAKD